MNIDSEFDEFRFIGCKDKLNTCNIITPGRLTNKNSQTNLPYSKVDKERIQNQYNRICAQNDGSTYNCCKVDMQPINKKEQDEINRFINEYPSTKLVIENNILTRIILSKYTLKTLLENNETGWEETTPYIYCKINKFSENKDANLKQYKIYDLFQEDCKETVCETLEGEITLKHILGDIDHSSQNSYMNDLAVADAIKNNSFDSLKSFVLKYKQVNNILTHNEEKNTLLHLIAKTKNLRMLNFVLLLKGNVNAVNYYGETPIFNAVKHNNLNIVEAILRQNNMALTPKNKKGETPIFQAVANGNKNTLLYLFNKGSSIIEVDNLGNNLIHHSIIHNPQYEFVVFLYKRGVPLEQRNNNQKMPIDLVERKLRALKKCQKIMEQSNNNNSNNINNSNNSNNSNNNPRYYYNNHNNDYKQLSEYQEIKNYNPRKYPEILQQLNSIHSFINKNVFINEKGKKVNNLTTNFKSSPVEIKDFICYKNIELPTDNREEVIKNVSDRRDCQNKGGYVVENQNELTKIDVEYLDELEAKELKDDDLFYNQKYQKIVRRPDYVQEVSEEEDSNSNTNLKKHANCITDQELMNNKELLEGFLISKKNETKKNLEDKDTCPLVDYTKYIIVFIIIGLLFVFIMNKN